MTEWLDMLAAKRRFGMKPGLDSIKAVLDELGNPECRLRRVIHIAGTNGKGATAAILDACLGSAGYRVGRYTSPHLVKLNERFFYRGAPLDDATLERSALQVASLKSQGGDSPLTFFEALTAVGFLVYVGLDPDYLVLETGLGGRLDATNAWRDPAADAPFPDGSLSIITRIGLDHCDWLGDTVEKIAAEKAGIIKPGVPILLGRNVDSVREVVERRARSLGSPFYYAPDLADESEIPSDFSLRGSFNRENALTALAALKLLNSIEKSINRKIEKFSPGFSRVVWPGRFQQIGRYIVDGAHNPPAARALSAALSEEYGDRAFTLIAGFCADKDIDETLRILKPHISSAIAVKTTNPRSLSPEDLAAKMRSLGIPAVAAPSLSAALARIKKSGGSSGSLSGTHGTHETSATCDDCAPRSSSINQSPNTPIQSVNRLIGQSINTIISPSVLICGSLFLAGEAVVKLGGFPWQSDRADPSEGPHR